MSCRVIAHHGSSQKEESKLFDSLRLVLNCEKNTSFDLYSFVFVFLEGTENFHLLEIQVSVLCGHTY